VLICEENRKSVDVGQGRPKVSVTREHFAQMGLHTSVKSAGSAVITSLTPRLKPFPAMTITG